MRSCHPTQYITRMFCRRHWPTLWHAATLTCSNFSACHAHILSCRVLGGFCFLASGCSVPKNLLRAAKPASATTLSCPLKSLVLCVATEYTLGCDALLLSPPPPLPLALCVSCSCSMCSWKGLILSVASSLVPKYPRPLNPKLSIMLLTPTLSRRSLGRLHYVPRT